ncbi:hypothetical protein BDW59DRAFT_178440 [Aspergillus cavernicola]|uniref:chitinase n=1 Tax=Aspergillus cavernicola TaxID=176166 RepID=A0ABR4IP15_9EURO
MSFASKMLPVTPRTHANRWGFCGTTEEFCKETDDEETSCQSNCGQPERQTCSSGWEQRRIAYYETWADTRECDAFRPEDIPVKALTHLNIAFGGIQDSRVTIESSEMVSRIVKLKRRNRSLKVFIAIGGWAFSDPGSTRTAWSDMASTLNNRKKFINSLMDLFETFGLDGVDLDWEYPVAKDRGGKDEDYENYVSLVREMRESFQERNPSWDISMAIPASYWYLQHFDVSAMQTEVSWFNLMSYDMRGKWDQFNEWTGPYIFGHTNITEIENGVDLLRRNNINLFKVSLGMGFYGRTFTLADPKCSEPGCVFSDAGLRGECSGESGILTFKEIMARQRRLNQKVVKYDEDSGVKYMIYDEDQWITYDDEESFEKKREMLEKECFGGVMIWAIDQDTEDFQALTGLLGDKWVTDELFEGGDLSDEEKEALVDEMGGLTGDGCYVTSGCVGGEPTIEGNPNCNKGDVVVAIVHSPTESFHELYGLLSHAADTCGLGQYKRVCCPADSPAVNCQSVGMPEGDSTKCTGGKAEETCGNGRYELITDRYVDAVGQTKCSSGAISVCCDAAPELQKCHWSPCTVFHTCSDGYAQPIATRGDFCDEGEAQNFCCELDAALDNCHWVPEVETYEQSEDDDITLINLPSIEECSKSGCPSTQFTAAKAKLPDRSAGKRAPCDYYSPGIRHHLCCDPDPNRDLPFDLKKIFPNPIEEDVIYRYTDNYGNNDHDPDGPDEVDVGDDPYGFIVLDGDEGALQGEFSSNFIFTRSDDGSGNPIRKRETLTRDDPNLVDWVFEHEESSHLIYCRRGRDKKCDKVFLGGAADTIITLPRHIGSGPYARIVSIEPVHLHYLSDFHKSKRAIEGHDSIVYNLTFDYRFELIKREDSTVNMRIDYTNLVPYWDEITGEESDVGKEKRALRAEKRWWGGFSDWLAKLTTVRSSDEGKLPLSINKRMLLYSKRARCSRNNVQLDAGLDVTLDAKFGMNARWAYYAQGTIVPLSIDTVYAYFEVTPEARAVIEVEGSAEMQYNSPRIKIIDTLSYPGLAIKGIAAVGPTLDLYASMEAYARIAGKLTGGAKITFPRYEMYFPQNDDSEEFQRFLEPSRDDEQRAGGTEMAPILDASVEADVHIDFKLTPEANLGIRVNSPIGSNGAVLDAQIIGFVNNTLRFEVQAEAHGGIENPPAASYSVFIKFFYNFGYGGRAVFKWLGEYALKPRTLWSGLGREKILWEHHGSTAASKRSVLPESGGPDRFIPLYNLSSIPDTERGLFPRSLERRTTLEDVAAFNGETPFFTCNDGGQCSSGGCAGGACEWNPADSQSTTKRQADDDDDDDDSGEPMDVDPSQSCVSAIPAMMYNCRYFPDDVVPATNKQIGGICRNILEAFSTSGLGSGPFSATYNTLGNSELGGNREIACGTGSVHKFAIVDAQGNPKDHTETWSEQCILESDVLSEITGKPKGRPGNGNWLSCDEFPFNSLAEGGNPLTLNRKCVPGYQQEIQGNVNQLPRRLQQEVSWTDSNGETKKAFKRWTIDWASSSAKGRINNPDKDTAWNWAENNKKSFTFHLFNSDSETTVTGSRYEVFNHKLVTKSGFEGNMVNVVAAINLFDNDKYTYDGFNAWCRNDVGGLRNHKLWGDNYPKFVRIKGCKVEFDNGAASAKIKRGEQPTPEEMFKITRVEMVEDAPEFEIPVPDDVFEN